MLKSAAKAFLAKNPSVLKELKREKAALLALSDSRFTVKLYPPVPDPPRSRLKSYQSSTHICLLEELAPGAPVSRLLRVYKSLPLPLVRLVSAQLVGLLVDMQKKAYVHRDIKASHVFLDSDLHARVIDFGFARPLEKARAGSVCGTYHMMAPEMLVLTLKDHADAAKAGYSFGVDLYALGTLMYEMRVGSPPAGYVREGGETVYAELFEKASRGWGKELEALVDKAQASDAERDLVTKLLEPDPAKRITLEAVMAHPFFKGVDWANPRGTESGGILEEFASYIGRLAACENSIDVAGNRGNVSTESTKREQSADPDPFAAFG